MTTGTRQPGDFCWINLVTPRPAEAMEFFGQVLGWTYFEMPGLGHGMKVDGRDIGGLFDTDGPGCPPGMAPVLGVMVKVEDADATAARVRELGGKAEPAFAIADHGRMAVCHDPTGAAFDVWESGTQNGSDADRSRHGVPSWPELRTTDAELATRFYTALFGWGAEKRMMLGRMYTSFQHATHPVAGMMSIPPGQGGTTPRWETYFTVDDADEAARLAQRLGATICAPPEDIPGIGRAAVIESPQGVPFAVIKYLPRTGQG